MCKNPKWHVITLYKQNGKGMLREMTRRTSPGSFVRVGWWCITSPAFSMAAQHVLEECTGEMLHLVTSCSVSVKANPLRHHVLRQAAKKPLDLLQSWTVSHVSLASLPKASLSFNRSCVQFVPRLLWVVWSFVFLAENLILCLCLPASSKLQTAM